MEKPDDEQRPLLADAPSSPDDLSADSSEEEYKDKEKFDEEEGSEMTRRKKIEAVKEREPDVPRKAAQVIWGLPSTYSEAYFQERRDRVFRSKENLDKYPLGFPGYPLKRGGYSALDIDSEEYYFEHADPTLYPHTRSSPNYIPPPPNPPRKVYSSSSSDLHVQTDEEDDALLSMIIFVVGFCMPCIWCLGCFYCRSPSNKARWYGFASISMILCCIISVGLTVAGVVLGVVFNVVEL